jgi:PAS domain S-box-containing protein
MDRQFTELVERARPAVIVKDGDGYCVYASRREEELRGAGRGELVGRHITELVDADPRLVEREFERQKQDGTWVGQYTTRDATGSLVRLRTYNFTHLEWDGNALYVSFGYVLKPHARQDRDGPVQLARSGLSTADLCIAQFCVDGYSDDEMGILLGLPPERVHDLVASFLHHTDAKSRTEACVRVLKSRLAV